MKEWMEVNPPHLSPLKGGRTSAHLSNKTIILENVKILNDEFFGNSSRVERGPHLWPQIPGHPWTSGVAQTPASTLGRRMCRSSLGSGTGVEGLGHREIERGRGGERGTERGKRVI